MTDWTLDKPLGKYLGMTIMLMKNRHPVCHHLMVYYVSNIDPEEDKNQRVACNEPSCPVYWKKQIDCAVRDKEQQEEADARD